MKQQVRRLSTALVFGALLVGFLLLVVRSGAVPADAAPAAQAPATDAPRLGETLQRAALAPTQPITSTSYFPLIFKNWFAAYDHREYFNWPQTTDWQYGSVRNTVTW